MKSIHKLLKVVDPVNLCIRHASQKHLKSSKTLFALYMCACTPINYILNFFFFDNFDKMRVLNAEVSMKQKITNKKHEIWSLKSV